MCAVDPGVGVCLRTLINPPEFCGGIPTSYPGELVQQQALGSANFEIATGTGAPATGAIVQNVLRGYNFVCKATVPEAYNPAPTGLVTSPWIYEGYTGANGQVTFGADSFIPTVTYCAGNIPIEPRLAELVSLGRTVCSALQVRSATTSTTTAALSGTFSAAAVADIRSCPTLSTTDMATSAMTNKDAVMNVPAYDGICLNQGPDIIKGVGPIDYSYVYNERQFAKGSTVLTNVTAGCLIISPYINKPAIDATAAFGSYAAGTILGFQTPYRPWWIGSRITATFNDANNTSTPSMVQAIPLYYQATWDSVDGLNIFRGNAVPITYVQSVSAAFNVQADAHDPPLGYGFFGWLLTIDQPLNSIGFLCFREDLPELYDPSNIGGIRLVRWNSLGAGQTLQFEYRGMVEAVPSGNTAKLLRQMPYVGTGRDNLLNILRVLYSHPSCSLARVMTMSGWFHFLDSPLSGDVLDERLVRVLELEHFRVTPVPQLSDPSSSVRLPALGWKRTRDSGDVEGDSGSNVEKGVQLAFENHDLYSNSDAFSAPHLPTSGFSLKQHMTEPARSMQASGMYGAAMYGAGMRRQPRRPVPTALLGNNASPLSTLIQTASSILPLLF